LRHQLAAGGPRAEAASSAPIIEQVRQGAWLKVSAVCPRTGREASAIGPASAAGALELLALRKLARS
jgi:hypothetical protein